ncbi:MAG: hypothetical protein ACRC5H_10875 [Treponemataceae bacterium]
MKFSRLSTYKINKIVLCFSEDITATAAAKIVKVNRNTINSYYKFIREKIVQKAIAEAAKNAGNLKLMKAILVHGEFNKQVCTESEDEVLQEKRLFLGC